MAIDQDALEAMTWAQAYVPEVLRTFMRVAGIAPGTYRTAGPKSTGSLASCYWERESSLSGNFDSILANENLKGPGVVTIAASDKGFKTSGCQEWTPA